MKPRVATSSTRRSAVIAAHTASSRGARAFSSGFDEKLETASTVTLAGAHRAVGVPVCSGGVVVVPEVAAAVHPTLIAVRHDLLVPHRPVLEVIPGHVRRAIGIVMPT